MTGPFADPDALDPEDPAPQRPLARAALFAALEAFLRAEGRAGFGALRVAHERWACLGRDGE